MDTTKLCDLGEIVQKTKIKLETEFTYSDISLGATFKAAFAKSIKNSGNNVQYNSTTAIITTSSGQRIYAPNQWFLIATYAVDLIKEIIRYREYTEKLIDENIASFTDKNGKHLEKKDIYKILKSSDNDFVLSNFKQLMRTLLTSLGQDADTVSSNLEKLCRFVSDDKWWLGGKGIERSNDFYVSPALGVLGLVNASQSYVATIVYLYINDASVYAELPNIIASEAEIEGENTLYDVNEYQRAAEILNNYITETGFQFEMTEDELHGLLAAFKAKFSPEKLMEYSDDELMKVMFYTAEQTNDSMCYWLEFNKDIRSQFGSIAGGSSLKFGIYQNKEHEWITGSPTKKEMLSEEDALELGKEIRDRLIRGAEVIRASRLESLADYEKLHDTLIEEIGPTATNGWIHKYFFMIFPDKFVTMHSEEWQKHILRALQIRPSEKLYGRSGQLSLVAKYANKMATHLFQAAY